MDRAVGILFKSSIIFYALILTYCNSQLSDKASLEEISGSLREKYNGIILADCLKNFSVETITSLLETPVVLDTVIVEAGHHENEYFLKARINNSINNKIYGEFKCTKEIYNSYLESESTSFIIAVNITQIDSLHVTAELETISNEILLFNTRDEIYIAGNCLEIVETPGQGEIIKKNLN